MASIPSSAAVSEAQDAALAFPPPLSKNDLFFSKPHSPSLTKLSTAGLGASSNDDAMVPSMASSTPAAAPSRKHSAWDDAFSKSSTPTPRPPPRLAPMPRSPTTPSSSMPPTPTARSPPPPIVIPISTSAVVPSSTPVLSKGDLLELSNAKSRFASSAAHTRSFSYGQAHSHHGGNIFAHTASAGTAAGVGTIAVGGSPSLGLMSTMGAMVGGLGMGFNPDRIPVHTEEGDHTTGEDEDVDHSTPPSRGSHSILNHATPADARPQPHNYRHSHQLPSRPSQPPFHRNPLPPSSSQSNLFSNLPSPLTRTVVGSTNIFRDPPASSHSGLSSWVSSQQNPQKVNGDDISESSVLNQDSNPGSAAPVSSAPNSGGQRKIYPGLKNSVGPYKLLHNIGRGSFSEVKMAVDTRSGDHVAIKVMSRAMIQSSDRLGISVQRESDLLKSIHHPNIIGFREVVETSLQMCIVLDYASGGELFEFVADKRAIASEADIQFIFAQIVDAVHYLHENNVVHRDLKLENVLLEPRVGAPLRPKVKLTDFGLAKVIEPDAPLLTTRCGSEDYAAPEIILGQAYDGREADIWSLGVVLYALLVGFLPFNMRPGMSRKSFLSMVAHAEFGFPGESVAIKRASLMDLHNRNGSTTSLGSAHSASAAEIFQQQQQHKVAAAAVAATATSPTMMTIPTESSILHAATVPDTLASSSSLSVSNLAASTAASAAEDITHVMVVPKMRGVSAVSNESKDLVRWLLQTQGARRPMSAELFHHPWVVAGRQAVAAAAAAEAGVQ